MDNTTTIGEEKMGGYISKLVFNNGLEISIKENEYGGTTFEVVL